MKNADSKTSNPFNLNEAKIEGINKKGLLTREPSTKHTFETKFPKQPSK